MKRSIAPLLFLLSVAVTLSISPLYAQDTIPLPEVKDVNNLAPGHEKELRVGDRIRVQVDDLSKLIARKPHDTSSIILYLDSIPMTDISAAYYDLCDNTIFFDLKRDGGTDPWDLFYQSPTHWTQFVHVSVGYKNVCSLPTQAVVSLIIIRKGYFWFAVIIIVLMFILLIFALKRGLLKDDSTFPLAERPYSLSRSQLTFWTFIIAICYVFIALVTGELAPLSTSSLILLGISGVTTAAASTIDNNDKLNKLNRQQDIFATDGFLNDVLSDGKGISVNRFQMFMFNIILGVFFLQQVFTRLQMPEFDTNVLTLLGISNITYAGLKINENKGAPAAPAEDTNNEEVPPVG